MLASITTTLHSSCSCCIHSSWRSSCRRRDCYSSSFRASSSIRLSSSSNSNRSSLSAKRSHLVFSSRRSQKRRCLWGLSPRRQNRPGLPSCHLGLKRPTRSTRRRCTSLDSPFQPKVLGRQPPIHKNSQSISKRSRTSSSSSRPKRTSTPKKSNSYKKLSRSDSTRWSSSKKRPTNWK